MIDLQPKYRELVTSILAEYMPEAKVYAFGSRAHLTAKPHSDLDLIIIAQEAIPISDLYALEEAFAESDLPFRVDVLDWHALSDEFREQIATGMKVLD